MYNIVESLAMSMAFDKLKMYSTLQKDRKLLKSLQICGHPITVVHDFQDFGVFFCAAKRQTAKCFKTRFFKAQHRFQKLQVVNWSDFRKAKSFSRVVLPAVLYGVELTHVSAFSYKLLRGRSSAALWGLGELS